MWMRCHWTGRGRVLLLKCKAFLILVSSMHLATSENNFLNINGPIWFKDKNQLKMVHDLKHSYHMAGAGQAVSFWYPLDAVSRGTSTGQRGSRCGQRRSRCGRVDVKPRWWLQSYSVCDRGRCSFYRRAVNQMPKDSAGIEDCELRGRAPGKCSSWHYSAFYSPNRNSSWMILVSIK